MPLPSVKFRLMAEADRRDKKYELEKLGVALYCLRITVTGRPVTTTEGGSGWSAETQLNAGVYGKFPSESGR